MIRLNGRPGWRWACLLVVALGLAACGQVQSESATELLCFEATGHTLRGNFLRRFEQVGGVATLGHPVSEPFEQDGRLVQYFEYGRLEDHPDNPGGATVKPSLLGEKLGRRYPPVAAGRAPSTQDRNSRFFARSGYAVSGDFLDYFRSHGGLAWFGFPIAEPLVVDGRLVQDFQRARLIWQPQNSDEPVVREPIGRVFFQAQNLDPALLAPVTCPDDALRVE